MGSVGPGTDRQAIGFSLIFLLETLTVPRQTAWRASRLHPGARLRRTSGRSLADLDHLCLRSSTRRPASAANGQPQPGELYVGCDRTCRFTAGAASMPASYWGCDIGGENNTHLARISFDGQGRPHQIEYDFEGRSVRDLARHIWRESGAANAPIFLVLDAALSHCLTSPAGWRPADVILCELVDPILRPREATRYSSRIVSPNGLRGHRHLEMAEQFGAYFLTAETHPTACLTLMGADPHQVFGYKRREGNTLTKLAAWISGQWFSGSHVPESEGQMDALVCAMVAAGLGGHQFSGLQLVTPVLGNPAARTACGLESPDPALPSISLQGVSPYYLLTSVAMGAHFLEQAPPVVPEVASDVRR